MITIRSLRLFSGLVLAVFITLHLVNHALGVISVDAQEAMRRVVSPVWRSVPGTVMLYAALIGHALLGLYALWRRETLRMPRWEFAQLALGLAVPLLLIPHVFGSRVAASMLGVDTTYEVVVRSLSSAPEIALRQSLLVAIVWGHLVVGLHHWLRLKPRYRRWVGVAYPAAVLVPTLALLGFWGASVELRSAAGAGAQGAPPVGQGVAHDGYGNPNAGAGPAAAADETGQRARLEQIRESTAATFIGLLALVLVARPARRLLRERRGTYRLLHSSGRSITAPIGQSLLETLREAGIPHASVCGGRARCTTCRVRVGRGPVPLPPPSALEMHALQRIDAAPDVRLACQLRPQRDVRITPLLPANADVTKAMARESQGRERAVAVMFVDLRESSRLGEERLPYDVFFILNRFFAELSDALDETGGYYSTFNGDGLMALYGMSTGLKQGCRDAMHGAMAIAVRLERINAALASELREPLRAGISIHAGEAIVGTMGPPAHPILSALGDTVNVAARLEAETKAHGCALVVSRACADAAEVDLAAFPEFTVRVRGRDQPVSYFVIEQAAALEPALRRPGAAATPAEAESVAATARAGRDAGARADGATSR